MAAETDAPRTMGPVVLEASEPSARRRLLRDPANHQILLSGVAVVATAVAASAVALAKIGWRGPQDLRTFFAYAGDGLDVEALATAVAQGGVADYPFAGSSFGWPLGSQTQYYPMTDWVHIWILKLLSAFPGSDAQLALNLYYLLGFGLAAASFFALARSARVTVWVSATLAFAFALSPYVWYRSPHFFLAKVWVIPLALIPIVIALRRASDGDEANEPRSLLRTWTMLIIPSALVGVSGVYYAAFTVLAWVPAAIILLTRWRRGLAWLVAPLTVALTTLLGLLPSLLYISQNPSYAEVTARYPNEILLYAGSALDLMYDALAVVGRVVERPIVPDDPTRNVESVGLGLAGLIALVTTLAVITVTLVRRARSARDAQETSHAWAFSGPPLVALWVGLALVWLLAWYQRAGLNYLIATLVTTQLRAYGRLTPFLICLSLIGVGLIATNLWNHRSRLPKVMSAALVGTIAIGAVANAKVLPTLVDNPALNTERRSTEAFVDRAKAAVSPDCPIAQAPLVPWPEFAGFERFGTDESWRVALAAAPTPVSFGAVKETPESAWQAPYYLSSPATTAYLSAAVGFCWMSVDLDGYADPAAQEAAATALLGPPISEARDLGLVAYPLLPLWQRLESELGPAEAMSAREYLTQPVAATAGDGLALFRLYGTTAITSLLSPDPGVLLLRNSGDSPRVARVTLDPASAAAGVRLGAAFSQDSVEVAVAPRGTAELSITGPQGAQVVARLNVRDGWLVTDRGLVQTS